MLTNVKAVIFDMDGVIIDSEYLWRRAMIEGFNNIGIPFTETDCRITTGMRFKEVIEFWFQKHKYNQLTVTEFDTLVVDNLCQLIRHEGKPMKGVIEAFDFCKKQNFKIGLATSSNVRLMNTVIETLQINHYFDSLCSAQYLTHGKPHPQVFINCAEELNTHPSYCLVIEDSVNGVIAGKAAQMKVIAIPEEEHRSNLKFAIADYMLESLLDFIPNGLMF